MWTNLIYVLLLWGFLCPSQVHGKGKKRDLEVIRITKFGSYTVRQEMCLFIPSYGTCKKKIKVYGYSIVTNRCTQYYYSGCGGNPNRFASNGECRKICYVHSPKKSISQPDLYEYDEVTETVTMSTMSTEEYSEYPDNE